MMPLTYWLGVALSHSRAVQNYASLKWYKWNIAPCNLNNDGNEVHLLPELSSASPSIQKALLILLFFINHWLILILWLWRIVGDILGRAIWSKNNLLSVYFRGSLQKQPRVYSWLFICKNSPKMSHNHFQWTKAVIKKIRFSHWMTGAKALNTLHK